MRRTCYTLLCTVFVLTLLSPSLFSHEERAETSKVSAQIEAVIVDAYIKGIHIDRNPVAIRKGFHPEFTMHMISDNKMVTVGIEDWIERIEAGKKSNPDPSDTKTTHEFTLVNSSGNAAMARVEIFKDGKHIYTDYMSLYKFSDGWKIVNKIFYSHP